MESASELSRRLAENAEQVCRHYLSSGRRAGRYWLVGDVRNTPGRSLFVRLKGPFSGRGAAGRWVDAATGEHGDLLDLIAANLGLECFGDVAREARRFLAMPQPVGLDRSMATNTPSSNARVQHLLAMTSPIAGTLAETWLRHRAIDNSAGFDTLRYHPSCHVRSEAGLLETWPVMIAPVTDNAGRITGLMRTFLDRSGFAKAPLAAPRRALGSIGGNAVRFGRPDDVLVAGEGIETMLSLRMIMPSIPVVAALSASNLAKLDPPAHVCRLYVACDRDAAGHRAAEMLATRARSAGIETILLLPRFGDFNDDLRRIGPERLKRRLARQLAAEDVGRFLPARPLSERDLMSLRQPSAAPLAGRCLRPSR